MPPRHRANGRSKGSGRFLALPHFLLETPAWRSMSVYERAAYIEIAQLYDGANNGYLSMGVRRLAQRLNVSVNKANACVQVLIERGFIEVAQASGFNRKDRTSTEFRLTMHGCDRTRQPGSRAYQSWTPSEVEKKSTVARGDRTVPRGATVIPLGTAHGRTR